MVRIRLKKLGQRNRPSYRIVVIDSTRSRDGKYVQALGHYNPRTKELVLDQERAGYWLSKGAKPTDTVGRLIYRHAKSLLPPPTAPVETTPPAEPVPEEPGTTPAATQGGTDEGTG